MDFTPFQFVIFSILLICTHALSFTVITSIVAPVLVIDITSTILGMIIFDIVLIINKAWRSAKLPPGPFRFPFVGNIFQLGPKPHRSLAKLSRKYGPIMSLKLGSRTTIVVSSPEVAKLFLQKHDVALSRSVPSAVRQINHDEISVAWLPMGDQWRALRRICKESMFSEVKLAASEGLRRDKLRKMCHFVKECCETGQAVNVGEAAFTTSLNLMSATLFSREFAHYDSDSSQEMRVLMCNVMRCAGAPNLSDFFPILELIGIDPQGVSRDLKMHTQQLLLMFDRILQEKVENRADDDQAKDFSQRLLDDQTVSRDVINHLLLDLFIGGTVTSANTVEWAMAELLASPEKMSRLKQEIEQVLHEKGEVQEADTLGMPYLQAVVKETLRLHPPSPFLIPKKADTDLQINGYLVPKNAQVIVNVWATGRDPDIWEEAGFFLPERFLTDEINFIGKDLKLIPFGAGRRICPGLPLARRMIHLMLATLVGNFGWRPQDEGGFQMEEKFGLTLQKALPVEAFPSCNI